MKNKYRMYYIYVNKHLNILLKIIEIQKILKIIKKIKYNHEKINYTHFR